MKRAQHVSHYPQLEKMELFRHPQLCYMKALKDTPTWLKVTSTLQKDPNHNPQSHRKKCKVDVTNEAGGSLYQCQWHSAPGFRMHHALDYMKSPIMTEAKVIKTTGYIPLAIHPRCIWSHQRIVNFVKIDVYIVRSFQIHFDGYLT